MEDATTTTIQEQDLVYYDIDWNKVKTIKDIKVILQVLATRVVIDHNDSEDIEVFNSLEKILVKSEIQSD